MHHDEGSTKICCNQILGAQVCIIYQQTKMNTTLKSILQTIDLLKKSMQGDL